MVWNLGERVQAYTDPLFEFLIIVGAAVIGSDYWSSFVVSLLLSLLSFFFLFKGRAVQALLLGTVILFTSKAFLDYSISGLENPATHLAIAIYVWVYWCRTRDPFWLTFIAALSAVNRMDSVLLFVPSLLWVYSRSGWRAWKRVLAGASPFLVWEAFSVFYYGFPFPNTAYAKLNTGIAAGDSIQQGFHYLQSCISWDTVTALAIGAGIVIGFLWNDWPLALGALLSVAYVVRVGGDYMVGRFLTPAFVLCCAILIQHAPKKWITVWATAGAILLLGLLIPHPALLTTRNFGSNETGPLLEYFGIGDERMAWYPATGLLRGSRQPDQPDHVWREQGLAARASGSRFMDLMPVGMIPYFAGSQVFVYDRGALGDALTARLPMQSGPFRPGHYWRRPPAGYMESLQSGTNQIADKNLAEYYGHLRYVIRGDLWAPSRWREIAAINFGAYDRLLKVPAD